MSPTLKRIVLGLSVLLVVGVLAYPKLPSWNDAEEANATGANARGGGDALLVDAHVVEPVLLEDMVRSTGTIQANETIEVRSEVAGRVTDIAFREGTAVEEGALLVKINDSELQAQRARTELQRSLAATREDRQRKLLTEGGISQEVYDATENQLQVLEAELALLDAQIAKTEVRAPFDGVLGLREISKGSYISPETRVTTLQEVDPVRVDFTLPERYARRVSTGDAVRFTVEGLDTDFGGEIYAQDPTIQEGTRSVRLRARVPNADRQLFPGNFASITYVVERYEEALVVPAIAIVPSLEGRRVFVYDEGEAQPRSVETGLRTERNIQITSGLAPQDTVIISGLQRLRPGLAVRLSETTEGRLPEVAPGAAAEPNAQAAREESPSSGSSDRTPDEGP